MIRKIVLVILLMTTITSVMAGGIAISSTNRENNNAYFFPKNELSFSYYSNGFLNFDGPRPPSPIFWKASTKATNGGMLAFEHTIYHTKKWFSINLGSDFSYWATPFDNIEGLSLFVAFKLWIPICPGFRPYIFYSPAGPTMLSQNTFNNTNLGENFISQDLLGAGVQIGKKTALDIALIMVHYPNGDIFAQNTGFDVPVMLKIGIALP